MTEFERSTVTRHEYTLKSPTNWVEVATVLAALRQELGEDRSADRVTVEVRGKRIVFSYLVTETPS